MACLIALELGDTQAKRVRLFGPQITPESLQHWQQLIDSGKVGSVQIFINEGDPIPVVSYVASLLTDWTALSPIYENGSPRQGFSVYPLLSSLR